MTEALGAVLPLAIAIAIFPVPVIASVLLVGADRGRAKCLAFVAAWWLGLVIVGGIVLVFAGAADASDDGAPATWVSVVLLLLGLVLVGMAVQQWRGRPQHGQEAPMPGWMKAIDDFSLAKAAGAGIALSALNPKNVLLTAAAAAEIGDLGLSAGREMGVLIVFAVLATVGVAAPLVASLVLGARSSEVLDDVKEWLGRNSGVIMAVLLVLIGAKLIGDALTGFAA